MKRIPIILLALAAMLLTALAVSAQDVTKLKYPALNPVVIPKVEKVTLENGLRLYILEDNSLPIVRASVRLNCGGYLEPAEKVGLGTICGTVLRTGGTAKWTGDQIDEALESVGASVETSIGATSGSASMYTLAENLDLGMEVLAEVLRRPAFNQEKIDLAKVGLRSGISRRNDDPFSIGIREFLKAVYGADSPFARYPEYATVDAVTRTDLMMFHQACFHPENVQLAIWGAVNKDEIIAKVKQYFGDWEKGSFPVPPPPKVDYKYEQGIYYAEKADVNQTNIIMGHVGGFVTDPDYPALIVMNNILGGSFASRLFNNVRSKEGLAYSVGGAYTANVAYPGTFYSFASTKSETTAKAIKEIIKQIKSMQTIPPTPAEMSIGKDGYLNSFVFNFDSRSEVISRMMYYDFYGLPEDFLAKEKESVEKVTPADVMAAANRAIHSDALKIVVVGKGADFETPLDQLGLGTVANLDITIPANVPKKELVITDENLAKGKALLTKAATAHGGLKAIKAVKSVSMKGVSTVSTPGGDFPIPVEMLYQFPDKVRSQADVMGNKMIDIRNGETGWKMDRTGAFVPKTPDDIKQDAVETARNTILLLGQSDSPTLKAVYAGEGDAGGKAVSLVAIVGDDGQPTVTLGIDPTSGQLLSKEYWGNGFMGEGNMQEVYSDFKKSGAVLMPMSTLQNMNGQKMMVVSITELVINGAVPPGSFDKP
jgi:predicted Zn-dependent peptidase